MLQDLSSSGNLGSEGMFGWGGYYSTFLWIDPKEKLAGILLTQFAPIPAYPINKEFQTLMYQAIVK